MQHTSMTLTGVSGSQPTTIPLFGLIDHIKVTYTNGGVGGTLTLTDTQSGLQFLSRSNNTNVAGPLRKVAIDPSGTTIDTSGGERMPVMSTVTAAWANHASNTSILVEIWWL